ncbi:GntR family transcriptional regulator [Salimicrobium humidisoli]|uniref:Phosphonate metabolism transcriptional regulator PhnF n=1 Tax=Salimicrobium humidisoli TaxID=2029857 RepID=A0ABX4HU34_9BACI|nr:GntR family transcriptional regulator [Salimicrobium humidisoli]PBB06362.1 phosphonate metabolism transcriptional regulator PhnF [Salimicrobium humidisoli]
MLNKESPLPMYYQIEEDLKRKIESGIYNYGEAIPSERELSETYEVSRMTVRQAILNMVRNRILYREKGRGTFVAEEKFEQPLQGVTSFSEDMKRRGLTPHNELLIFERQDPDETTKDLLQLKEEEVYYLKRIRYADDEPMAIEETFIPVHLFPELDADRLEGVSFYEYIETKTAHSIERARQTIEAGTAVFEEARPLSIEEGDAILRIERIGYLSTGVPFERNTSIYRSDRYKFISDMQREK